MKFIKSTASIFLGVFLVLGLLGQASAQDEKYSDAVQAFNNALEQAKAGEYEQAISMYNQAISLARQSESERASEIIQKSQNALPSIHYQNAVSKYKSFQKSKSLASLNETIDAFQETVDISKEYGDQNTQARAGQIVTQLYYNRSVLQFKSQDYSSALASLDQAIQRNPNYAKAYYQKGIVIKNRDNQSLDESLKMFDKAIEIGQKPAVNDQQIVRKAKESARDNLIFFGVKAMENKNFTESIDLLNRALKYDPQSPDAHYRLAEVYNKRAMWDQALQHAQQALNYERGGKTDKAKIYFELGTAYKAKGNKEAACSAFGNAAFGSFKSPAEHQMEYELKCKSSTR